MVAVQVNPAYNLFLIFKTAGSPIFEYAYFLKFLFLYPQKPTSSMTKIILSLLFKILKNSKKLINMTKN